MTSLSAALRILPYALKGIFTQDHENDRIILLFVLWNEYFDMVSANSFTDDSIKILEETAVRYSFVKMVLL